jgi:hypothetical protein
MVNASLGTEATSGKCPSPNGGAQKNRNGAGGNGGRFIAHWKPLDQLTYSVFGNGLGDFLPVLGSASQ